MTNLTPMELGWLVGILEGEGTFRYTGTHRVQLTMVDEDIVNTYVGLIKKETGKSIVIRSHQVKGRQDLFHADISGETARHIMRLIIPYMHYRRRQRIWQSLNKYVAPKLDLQALLSNVSFLRKVD